MINRDIRELEDNIIALLNASDVPIEAKRLIVSNIYNLVTKEADKAIIFESTPKKEEDKNGSTGN